MTKQGVIRGDASNAVIVSEARQSRRDRGVGSGTGLPRRCAPRNDRKKNACNDEERNTGDDKERNARDDEAGGYSRRRVGCCHCERSVGISLPEGEGRGGTAHGFEIDQNWYYFGNIPVMFGGVECLSMITNVHIRRVLPAARRCLADGLRIGGATPNYVERRAGTVAGNSPSPQTSPLGGERVALAPALARIEKEPRSGTVRMRMQISTEQTTDNLKGDIVK